MIAPSNPQTYDPSTYLNHGILIVTAAILAFIFVDVLFPTTDSNRRVWAMADARHDLYAALRGEGGRTEAEQSLLDASRIGAMANLKAGSLDDVTFMVHAADLAKVSRRIWRAKGQLGLPTANPPRERAYEKACAALMLIDDPELRTSAGVLLGTTDQNEDPLCADIAWAADLIATLSAAERRALRSSKRIWHGR